MITICGIFHVNTVLSFVHIIYVCILPKCNKIFQNLAETGMWTRKKSKNFEINIYHRKLNVRFLSLWFDLYEFLNVSLKSH